MVKFFGWGSEAAEGLGSCGVCVPGRKVILLNPKPYILVMLWPSQLAGRHKPVRPETPCKAALPCTLLGELRGVQGFRVLRFFGFGI